MKSMHMSTSEPLKHMSLPHLSWVFAAVILIISAVIISHVWFTFWRRCDQLNKKIGFHISIGNHLSMAVSMVSGLSIGTVIGGLEDAHLTLAYLLGLVVGTFIGVMTGVPFKHIAILDGMISGLMSGLMGVMVGTMVPLPGLYVVSVLLMVLFVIAWFLILHFLRMQTTEPTEETQVHSESMTVSDTSG